MLANLIAVGWNFALTDTLLYRDRRQRSFAGRITRFFLLGNADLLVRIPLLALLVDGAHVGVLIANLITLVASFVVRFVVLDKVIYRARSAKTTPLSVAPATRSTLAGCATEPATAALTETGTDEDAEEAVA
jgi:dolichol-phosphate mannosyltransferase